MYTVVGIERKVGEYQGKEYDNTILHCVFDKKECDGSAALSVKVKTARLDNPVELGDKLSFLYDQYGNVARVDIL